MAPPDVRRTASIIHAALTGGVVTFAAVVWLLRGTSQAPPAPGGLGGLRVVALVVGAVALALVTVLSQRVHPPRADGGPAEWQGALARAIGVWALAEGTAIAGMVFFLLGRDPLVLVLVPVGLALLAWHRPAALLEP